MKCRDAIILSILLLLCACSHQGPVESKSKKIDSKRYSIQVGEALRVSYPFSQYVEGSSFTCKGTRFPAYHEGGEYHAYIAESYFSDFNPYSCDLLVGNNILASALEITVVDRAFPEEKLTVQPKKVYLSVKDQLRVRNEQVILKTVYADTASAPLFDSAFQLPLQSKITSHYGVKRTFNGDVKGQHLGTDFRAAVGGPVPVGNSGRVVFADDLFYTGLTVIVDHGVGIFTVYGHLAAIKVDLGEYVPRGSIIGLSGATGRVSGPHLHWGVKVSGHYIDGTSLIRETTINNSGKL